MTCLMTQRAIKICHKNLKPSRQLDNIPALSRPKKQAANLVHVK